MRIITNPYFGAMNSARKDFFINNIGPSVFLTCWTFGKLYADEFIRIKTTFAGNKNWNNVLLVKGNAVPVKQSEQIFTYKQWKNQRLENPVGKFVVKCKVVQHAIISLILEIDGILVESIGDGSAPHQGRVFNTKKEAEEWFEHCKKFCFKPDIIFDNNEIEDNNMPEKEKKKLDAYYTPKKLALFMASKMTGKGPILDPFCGFGSLLSACIEQGTACEEDVIGYDIDPCAIEYCKKKFPKGHFEVKPYIWTPYKHPRNPEFKRSII
jgi:hypothetical protein